MILDRIANFGNISGMKKRTFRSKYVSPKVRAIKKSLLGGVRKLSPSRQIYNLKQRTLRKVGYYSRPMKALRYAKKHGVTSALKLFALRSITGRK